MRHDVQFISAVRKRQQRIFWARWLPVQEVESQFCSVIFMVQKKKKQQVLGLVQNRWAERALSSTTCQACLMKGPGIWRQER